MPTASVGPVFLPDIHLETWLVKFNKAGECTSPRTRQALLARLKQIEDTPVILFSHGWNNDFDDATEFYRKFLLQLQRLIAVHSPGKPVPLFIGVLWPSIWLSFDGGLQMASEGGPELTFHEQRIIDDLIDSLPERGRAPFQYLMAQNALDADQVHELSALLQTAWKSSDTSELNTDSDAPTQEDISAALNSLPVSITLTDAADDDDLPPTSIIGGVGMGGSAPVRPAGMLSYFDPRWALRLASVYQMKDRAGIVGKNGVSELLADTLNIINGPLHLVGHSYGCKVLLSALTHAASEKKVESALLLQPAVSHLCFAGKLPESTKAAGYANTVERIKQSLLMTYSAKDFALHNVFHLALRRHGDFGEIGIASDNAAPPVPSMFAALGGFGPRLSGQRLLGKLPEPLQHFDLPDGSSPVAFDGSDGQINGHGDVATPYTAWLMYLQLKK